MSLCAHSNLDIEDTTHFPRSLSHLGIFNSFANVDISAMVGRSDFELLDAGGSGYTTAWGRLTAWPRTNGESGAGAFVPDNPTGHQQVFVRTEPGYLRFIVSSSNLNSNTEDGASCSFARV